MFTRGIRNCFNARKITYLNIRFHVFIYALANIILVIDLIYGSLQHILFFSVIKETAVIA